MITSMIPNVENVFKNHHITNLTFLSVYNPHINYSWSQTLTVDDNQQIKDTGTAGLNLQQFFGQGVLFNGVDQDVKLINSSVGNVGSILLTMNVSNNTTNRYILAGASSSARFYLRASSANILEVGLGDGVFNTGLTLLQSANILALEWNNGTAKVKYNNTEVTWNYTGNTDTSNIVLASSTVFTIRPIAGVLKDVYKFNRQLTQTEKEKYNNQPNQFFMDSLEDSSCVLAIPMCEKGNQVRNYKNNTDYPISNYLTTCRTNAQRLTYGLQTSGFKRDTNGMILSKSNFLEADGVGYSNTGWIPKANEDWAIEWIGKFNTSTTEQGHVNAPSGSFNRVGICSGSAGVLFSRCGGTVINYASSQFNIYNYLVLLFNQSTKTFNLFRNGVFVTSHTNVNFSGAITPIFLSSQGGSTYFVDGDVRLFKVHQKALTQDEVTKNFNTYQAQGLLNA